MPEDRRPDEVLARVDRSGKRVLCGRRDSRGRCSCPGELGNVHRSGGRKIISSLVGWLPLTTPRVRSSCRLPGCPERGLRGYCPHHGGEPADRPGEGDAGRVVHDWWRLTRRNVNRRERAEKLRAADAITTEEARTLARPRWRRPDAGPFESQLRLPTRMQCPRCGRWNRLEAAELGVESAW
jgi:hypothetical protein